MDEMTTGAQLVRNPMTGRFAKGNRGGGRPPGSRDKLTRVRDMMANHVLGRDRAAGKSRLAAALDDLFETDKRAYVRLAATIFGKGAGAGAGKGAAGSDGGRKPMGIRAMVAVMERGPTALRADGSVISPGREPAALANAAMPRLPGVVDQGVGIDNPAPLADA